MDRTTVRTEVKELLVSGLRLTLGPEEILDDAPIFGQSEDGQGLGLDSIDALELVVLVEERFASHRGRGRRQTRVRVGRCARRLHPRGEGRLTEARGRGDRDHRRRSGLGAGGRHGGAPSRNRRRTLRDRSADALRTPRSIGGRRAGRGAGRRFRRSAATLALGSARTRRRRRGLSRGRARSRRACRRRARSRHDDRRDARDRGGVPPVARERAPARAALGIRRHAALDRRRRGGAAPGPPRAACHGVDRMLSGALAITAAADDPAWRAPVALAVGATPRSAGSPRRLRRTRRSTRAVSSVRRPPGLSLMKGGGARARRRRSRSGARRARVALLLGGRERGLRVTAPHQERRRHRRGTGRSGVLNPADAIDYVNGTAAAQHNDDAGLPLAPSSATGSRGSR